MYKTSFLGVSGIITGSLVMAATFPVTSKIALFGGLGLSFGGMYGMNKFGYEV